MNTTFNILNDNSTLFSEGRIVVSKNEEKAKIKKSKKDNIEKDIDTYRKFLLEYAGDFMYKGTMRPQVKSKYPIKNDLEKIKKLFAFEMKIIAYIDFLVYSGYNFDCPNKNHCIVTADIISIHNAIKSNNMRFFYLRESGFDSAFYLISLDTIAFVVRKTKEKINEHKRNDFRVVSCYQMIYDVLKEQFKNKKFTSIFLKLKNNAKNNRQGKTEIKKRDSELCRGTQKNLF